MRWLSLGKFAHFVLFGVLGFALVRAWPNVPTSRLLGCLCLLAASSEVLQLFAQGRETLLADVAINSVGALAGVGIVYVLRSALRVRPTLTK